MQHTRPRKFAAALLAAAVSLVGAVTIGAGSASAATKCAPFPDVDASNVHCANIAWLGSKGITKPADGLYHPADVVTRGQMVTFLYRLTHPGQSSPACDPGRFPDVSRSNVFCGYITWAATSGLTVGYPNGTFGSDKPVTRGAMATFLRRTTGQAQPACRTAPYSDVPVSSTFCAPIQWAKDTGVTAGIGGGKYGPSLPVTRQSMASFLHRVDTILSAAKPTSPKPPADTVTWDVYTVGVKIPQPADQRVNDNTLFEGDTKVVREGHIGWRTVTYKQKLVNGKKCGAPVQTKQEVTTAPVATIIHVGTKPKPAPKWIYHADIALEISRLVNEYRVSQLGPDKALSPIAEDSGIHPKDGQFTSQTPASLHAFGYTTAKEVVDAWIASPEHEQGMVSSYAPHGVTCSFWTENYPMALYGPVALCRM